MFSNTRFTKKTHPCFSQSVLNKMNEEVDEILELEFVYGYHDFEDFLEYAEERVLKKYKCSVLKGE